MNYKRFICALMAMLLAAALCASAMAKVVSPGEEFYFLDQANVLSEATEGEIFYSNQLLDEACGAQFVVVTLKTTGSESIDDYAYDLFKQWGIGDSKKQNGFLLLLAIDDDDYYYIAGSNLQSKLTSGTLGRYRDEYLEPDFAAKRYDAAAKSFFEVIFAYIAEIYNADVTTEQGIAMYEAWKAEGEGAMDAGYGAQGTGGYDNRYADADEGFGLGFIIVVLLLIILIAVIVRSRRRNSYAARTRVTPIIINTPRAPRGPVGPQPGPGGVRGQTPPQQGPSGFTGGLFGGSSGRTTYSQPNRSSGSLFGGSSSRTSGGSSRSFGGFRSSGGSRSFGSARGGGGATRGGGGGRGRH